MFDIILRNGTVIDGTGSERFRADVAIQGERIAAVDDLRNAESSQELDLQGKILAPGFIDVHNHSDGWMLVTPHLVPKTTQGFTTEILMADGISYAPVSPATAAEWLFYLRALNGLRLDHYRSWQTLEEYMQEIDRHNVQNAATHIPYANVRTLACGFGSRPVDDYQMQMIRNEIRCGLEMGAVGLSTGLDYISQCFSTTDELVDACAPMRGGSWPYVTHVRYKRGLLPALQEAFDIGRRAEVPVHISHLKVQPPYTAEQVLELVERTRRDVDVTFDVYPYQPGSTMLSYLLPYEVWQDGPIAALPRLRDAGVRDRFATSMKSFRLDLERLRIAWLPSRDNAEWIGQTLGRYVVASRKPVEQAICDLLLEERLAVLLVFDEGDDRLVDPFLSHDLYMMGTDGIHFPDGHVHPRMYGSVGRLLGSCVRDLGLFTLEQAVRRLSGFPAQRFGLSQRGLVRPNFFADLVAFDAARVQDEATFEQPRKQTMGIEHVFVNGTPILRDSQPLNLTGTLPGRWLKYGK